MERNRKRKVENEEKEIRRYDLFMKKEHKAVGILTRKQGEYSFTELKALVAYKKMIGEKYPKQREELQQLWDSINDREDPCMEAGRKIKASRSQCESTPTQVIEN